MTVKLNPTNWTATLVSSNDQSEGLVAPSQGNAQTLSNGDQLVDWGSLPYLSEFSSSGTLLFDADWPAGVNSYRGYLLPWNPRPRERGGPGAAWTPRRAVSSPDEAMGARRGY